VVQAQKEGEALQAAKAAQEAAEGQKEEEAVEQIMASIEGANDRQQLIEDLTDLMKGGKLDVTGCNGV
jgi:fatty acid-binding protein DegV